MTIAAIENQALDLVKQTLAEVRKHEYAIISYKTLIDACPDTIMLSIHGGETLRVFPDTTESIDMVLLLERWILKRHEQILVLLKDLNATLQDIESQA